MLRMDRSHSSKLSSIRCVWLAGPPPVVAAVFLCSDFNLLYLAFTDFFRACHLSFTESTSRIFPPTAFTSAVMVSYLSFFSLFVTVVLCFALNMSWCSTNPSTRTLTSTLEKSALRLRFDDPAAAIVIMTSRRPRVAPNNRLGKWHAVYRHLIGLANDGDITNIDW